MFISMVLVVGSIATIIKNKKIKKTPSRIFQGGIWFPGKDL